MAVGETFATPSCYGADVTKNRIQADLLDLTVFSSIEDAVTKMVAADDRYRVVTANVLRATWPDLHQMTLFLLSTIKRATGLHRGVVEGVRESNPHATFPLLRSYIELVILVAYVLHRPDYIQAVMTDPAEWQRGMPKRKGTQALMAVAAREFPTISAPYDELSDMGHFGSAAMWSAFTPDEIESEIADPEKRTIEWTNIPSWRHPDDPLKAAAHLLEFTEGFTRTVNAMTDRYLGPTGSSARPES